jgi:hypothetical protein
MRPDDRGFYFHFVHRTPVASYPFSPCTRCDFYTIKLAENVRKLHLDFGDSSHCIIDSIEAICRLAVEDMLQLEHLVLTLSNIQCVDSAGNMARLIEKINYSTDETGRLLSVSSKAFCAGPYVADYASESWFWQATEPRGHLAWVDDWTKKIAADAAAAEALFGQRRLTKAPATADAAGDDDFSDDEDSEFDFTDSDFDEDELDDSTPTPQ